MKFLTRSLVLFALVLAAPSLVSGQQADPAAPAAPSEEVEALLTEYEGLHRQLQGIQQRAMEDPDLAAAQIALGDRIRTAMESEDPTIAADLERAESLEAELQTAQQTGNAERLEELLEEAQQIEEHFVSVQQAVVSRTEIASAIGEFQSQLERKMNEVDPNAASLIQRFQELEVMLQQAFQGGA